MAAYYLSPVMVKLRKRPIALILHPSWYYILYIEKNFDKTHFLNFIKICVGGLKLIYTLLTT